MILAHKEAFIDPSNELSGESSQFLDYGRIPSLRKIEYDPELLSFVKIDQMKKPTSFLNQNILDFSQGFMTDHDIYYLMKAVQDIQGIATMKILPQGKHDYKKFGANCFKIIPLPFKDIVYSEIPLSYKIKQIVQKLKREKLKEISTFNKSSDANLKIDVLFDNEELSEAFNSCDEIKNDVYDFPHIIGLFNKSNYSFTNIKRHIFKAMQEFEITKDSKKGMILILTSDYIFLAPLVRPYFVYQNELDLYADPMFYAGIFNLPYIEAEWDETVVRKFVSLDLLKVLKTSSTNE